MNSAVGKRAQPIAVGKVSGAHGVRGQLRFHSYSGNLETLQAMKEVRLLLPDGTVRHATLLKAVRHGGKILLTLADLHSANDAEQLAGAELIIEQDQLPELPEDEYYWQDLIGLTVVTDGGEHLGRLSKIMETGANDVFLVQGAEKEYLIPAIAEVVRNIDLSKKVMTVFPLDGLLDL